MSYENNQSNSVIEVTNLATVKKKGFTKSAEVKFYIKEGDVADLKVCQFTDKHCACVCSEVNLIIKVENLGPDIASNVVLKDALSNENNLEVTAINVSKGNYSYDNGIFTWNVGEVSLEESPIAVITIIPKKPGTYTSTAIVTGDEHDPDLSNNFATVNINVKCCEDNIILWLLLLLILLLILCCICKSCENHGCKNHGCKRKSCC